MAFLINRPHTCLHVEIPKYRNVPIWSLAAMFHLILKSMKCDFSYVVHLRAVSFIRRLNITSDLISQTGYGLSIVDGLLESNRVKLLLCHDDVIKWKYFQRYWPFVRGIHRPLVNSPHKGQWRGAFMFSLIRPWINGWVNNREASDWRRHHARYEVTVV